MKPIVSKELIDVRYGLGSPESSKNRFNQLKRTFESGKEYRIFAEPVIMDGGRKITWMTEYNGTVINIKKLSKEEQSIAKEKLSVSIKKLLNAAKEFEDKTLIGFLYKCIEIPNIDDIHVIRSSKGDNVVLSQWGFLSDIPGAEKGLLDKIINAIKVSMNFNIVYNDDETPAPNAEVCFEFEGKKEIHKSNEDAMIVVENVKVDTFVKAYEIENNVPLDIQTYTCYEHGTYTVKVIRRVDMKFKVINSNNEILPNELFYIKYNEKEIKETTNENGEFFLKRIKLDTEIKTFQLDNNDEININNFICQKDEDEYLIVIQLPEVVVEPPPSKHNMRFKVVDNKDEIVANATVTVKYDGKKVVLTTDEYGYTVLEDVKPGTKVKVVAKGKKQKKQKK